MSPQPRTLPAGRTQRRVTSYQYYSTVKFNAAAVAVAPPGVGFTYTIPTGTRVIAFSYAIGDGSPNNGGFVLGDGAMTEAETNLIERNQTVGGQNVDIDGFACQLKPGSIPSGRFADSRLVAQLFTSVDAGLQINGGDNTFKLGNLGMLPGAGGMTGGGADNLGTQPIPGGRPTFEQPTNGWPVSGNFFRLPEGLTWRTKAETDSNINIVFTVRRDIVLTSGGDPDNPRANVLAAGGPPITLQAYTYPALVQAMILVHLKGMVYGTRSEAA